VPLKSLIGMSILRSHLLLPIALNAAGSQCILYVNNQPISSQRFELKLTSPENLGKNSYYFCQFHLSYSSGVEKVRYSLVEFQELHYLLVQNESFFHVRTSEVQDLLIMSLGVDHHIYFSSLHPNFGLVKHKSYLYINQQYLCC